MRLVPCLAALAAILTSLLVTSPASAQYRKVKVGTQAPALNVEEWLNGNPIIIEPDKIYVIEFWATWCPPCKRSIPHLNDLHNKLSPKGVTIVGISDEKPETVRSFVSKKGPAMSYLIGIDSGRQAYSSWMEAAGQEGIPCAFVIGKDRKIAWIGNPLDSEFDEVVVGLAEGTWDPESDKRATPTIEAARNAVKIKNFRDAYTHYENAIDVNPKHFANLAREKYKVMIVDAKDPAAAAEYGKTVLKKYSDQPAVLGDFAVMIMTDPALKESRDTQLAMTMCDVMLKVGGRDNAANLDRFATVLFNAGEVDKAVDVQTSAWMTAETSQKPAYRQRLDVYKAAQTRAEAGLRSKN